MKTIVAMNLLLRVFGFVADRQDLGSGAMAEPAQHNLDKICEGQGSEFISYP